MVVLPVLREGLVDPSYMQRATSIHPPFHPFLHGTHKTPPVFGFLTLNSLYRPSSFPLPNYK